MVGFGKTIRVTILPSRGGGCTPLCHTIMTGREGACTPIRDTITTSYGALAILGDPGGVSHIGYMDLSHRARRTQVANLIIETHTNCMLPRALSKCFSSLYFCAKRLY